MFIVTAEFVILPAHVDDFHRALRDQAQNTMNREPECHQFDVCVDSQDRRRILLYEVYTNDAAFRAHLETDHFLVFDATVRKWVERKTIQLWSRVAFDT